MMKTGFESSKRSNEELNELKQILVMSLEGYPFPTGWGHVSHTPSPKLVARCVVDVCGYSGKEGAIGDEARYRETLERIKKIVMVSLFDPDSPVYT